MKSLSQIFNTETLSTKTNESFAYGQYSFDPDQDPRKPDMFSVKSTPEEQRAPLFELENAYVNDPTINKGINNIVEVIMSAKYKFEGDPESITMLQDFLDGLGKNGGNTDWDRLLHLTFRHMCVYGRTFHEVIFNQPETKILDIDFIDPKKMDYAKNAASRILLDAYSNPVGWIETIPIQDIYVLGPLKSDPIPKDVILLANQIYFRPERVVQYKLYEIGDGFYPVGLVEPILNYSRWKRTMFEALANVYYRTAFPIKIFRVGDQFHEPTSDLLDKTNKQLKDTSYRSSFAIPNYVEPIIMESKKTDTVNDYITQFINQEVTMLGPSAFVTGLGEKANKSVLARQEFLWKLSIKDIIKRTISSIENDLFARICRVNGIPSVPKIVWGEISLDELDSKADRLAKYVSAGILHPDEEIENLIRHYEGFKEFEGVYEVPQKDTPKEGDENAGKTKQPQGRTTVKKP